MNTHIIDSTPR